MTYFIRHLLCYTRCYFTLAMLVNNAFGRLGLWDDPLIHSDTNSQIIYKSQMTALSEQFQNQIAIWFK
jgi:hypothetical protein